MDKKREKFVELAEKRVTRAMKDMRLLGNLANRSNYAYTEEDAKKIVNALELEVRNVRRKFENTGSDQEVTFKL